jgi:hypothetical protein
MKIYGEVEGSRRFIFEATGAEGFSADGRYDTPEGTFQFRIVMERKDLTAGTIIQFTFELAAGALVANAASRIWRAAKHTVRRLRLNGRDVPVDESEILKVLREAQGKSSETPDEREV